MKLIKHLAIITLCISSLTLFASDGETEQANPKSETYESLMDQFGQLVDEAKPLHNDEMEAAQAYKDAVKRHAEDKEINELKSKWKLASEKHLALVRKYTEILKKANNLFTA